MTDQRYQGDGGGCSNRTTRVRAGSSSGGLIKGLLRRCCSINEAYRIAISGEPGLDLLKFLAIFNS
jgi:hypothetical protein